MSGKLYIRSGKRGHVCLLSEAGRQAIIAGNKKPRSEESERRRLEAMREACGRPEIREKISNSIKAKWRDEEYRAKNLRGRIPPIFKDRGRGLLEDAER